MTTEHPPMDAPPAETPPAEAPPTETPPTETPPTEALPTADASQPLEAPPAETPPAADATQPLDVPPAPGIVANEPPPRQRRRDRVLGTVGQAVGIIGLVVCLVLAFGVVLARGWAVGTVDDVAAAAVAQVAKAEPLLSQASAKVGEISGRVSTVADIAAGIAANPIPVPGVAEGLRTALAGVSDRYQALRSNYIDVRESLVSLGDRLQTLNRLVPGFSIPEGPTDALAALDARLREFDANVTGFIDIEPGQGPLNLVATAIAERAAEVNARIEGVQGRLADVEERISALEARILDAADSIKTAITIGSIGSMLLWFYLALLHWVLFRHSGEIRRKQPAG